MGRRASRELAMKLLYQLEIQKEDRDEQLKTALEQEPVNESDKKYIEKVVDGVFKNCAYLDNLIETHAKGWKLNRISKVDLAILRLGFYEICYMDDIPYNVSINEAVELAKKYSGEEAGAFINGILGKVQKGSKNPEDSIQEEQ
ncbi:MAG: transcription antitermination factor NusB [Bacillota bacterium]|nr:transcription antitermination factor NusB [Bacillota bacterium]